MEFYEFRDKMQENFDKISKDATNLFEVDVDKDELWALYLSSFPAGTNLIYRERSEYDCSCCRHFVKTIGNAVVIKDNVMTSVWDFEVEDEKYQTVIDALSKYVKAHAISGVFISNSNHVGTEKNHELLEDGKIRTWNHFYLTVPPKFVDRYGGINETKGEKLSSKNVFKRSLEELSKESVMTVLELISQNSLYKGAEWESLLKEFLKHKKAYMKLSDKEKENYAWEKASSAGGALTRIRNHSIGTLLVNLSEGMELDLAVKKYEQIVAPSNYKRPKPIFTKKMLEEAQKTVEKLGYSDSLARRYARIDDITINNVLFANKDSARSMGGLDIFEQMKQEASLDPKKFSKVEEVSIETFINNVLPTANEVELFLENRHAANMVSLIAPVNENSKNMFKWGNSFSWAYSGNIADSSMRERVKSAGGSVDGVLRFTIQWNDLDYDHNDLDAHCYEANNRLIYFGDKVDRLTGGTLDVDIINPSEGHPAVENITWANIKSMPEGTYRFLVHGYSNRGGRKGFRAEIEFNGQIYSFDYNQEVRHREKVDVAEVILKDGVFSIREHLPSSVSSREIWGVNTNQFVPVSVVMFSPNYWDEQTGIGNKHYLFMLKDCINSESPNSFYNEFLKEELTKHRKVLEALGSKLKVEESEEQLSGVGFSSTRRNDIIVKVKGLSERVIKLKF